MWLPNLTTILAGNQFRDNAKDSSVQLGKMLNYMKDTYSKTTGYTMQRYKNNNTVTKQTFALSYLGGINKLTPQSASLANNNVKPFEVRLKS